MVPAISAASELPDDIEAVAVGVFSDRMAEGDEPIDWAFLAATGFEGKVGTVATLPGEGGAVQYVVGLGPAADVDLDDFRRAAGAVARAARRQPRIGLALAELAPERLEPVLVATALAEGAALGAYRFDAYKTEEPEPRLREVVVETADAAAVLRGAAIADGVAIARDFVNRSGSDLTARRFAEEIYDLGSQRGFAVQVSDEMDIDRLGMGGLLGVNRGSAEPARFVELSWDPVDTSAGTVALIGKGITFDSGGLSIKSTEGMLSMKADMSGAAAVVGAFCCLAATAPKVAVRGYLPLTDNMSGDDAMRLGDVLVIRDGTTVEVHNTDAEGRLVLADALVTAGLAEPDAIIDLATLTGACVVALGNKIAGLFGNDEALVDRIRAAAQASGERVWRLPLPPDQRRQLESDVAQLKNVGGREGGALTAAQFLSTFVPDGIPWAHLDIAGPAWAKEADELTGKGGTGFGVRLLLEVLRTSASGEPAA